MSSCCFLIAIVRRELCVAVFSVFLCRLDWFETIESVTKNNLLPQTPEFGPYSHPQCAPQKVNIF